MLTEAVAPAAPDPELFPTMVRPPAYMPPSPPASAPEPPAFRPVAPPPPEPAPVAPAEPPYAAARPAAFEERWPTGGLDEESPTEESPTAETDAAVAGAPKEDEPIRGFFFGRRMDDMDDTFPGEDGVKKDKPRDFEW